MEDALFNHLQNESTVWPAVCGTEPERAVRGLRAAERNVNCTSLSKYDFNNRELFMCWCV